MPDNLTTQDSDLATIPKLSTIATEQLPDLSHAQRIKIISGAKNADGGDVNFGPAASGGDSQSNRTLGVSAVQGPNIPATKGVIIRADRGNTGIVYIGLDSAITAGTTAGTDGMPLRAGDALSIPVANANQLWAIASATSQVVYFLAI